jgi:type I restriction enzyme M protein
VNNKKITLTQLEQYLSRAAWILKGPVDASDFKVYIFPLLFFKRISDVYDEEYRIALSVWFEEVELNNLNLQKELEVQKEKIKELTDYVIFSNCINEDEKY